MLIHVCVLVCVAPPMVVGAWSMAEVLQQLFEYYCYLIPRIFKKLVYIIIGASRSDPHRIVPYSGSRSVTKLYIRHIIMLL